jgi:hypothetical protein
MLVNNQFKFFNKSGDNINPDYLPYVEATVIDPEGTGKNALLKAYTNFSGVIVHVHIADGGFNYSANSYVVFSTRPAITKTWQTDPTALTINVNGEITGFALPSSYENISWPFPGVYSFSNYFLQNVSAGLIESENFFIIEKVLDANGDVAYTYPRVEEYGPFYFSGYTADGVAATLDIRTYSSLNTGKIVSTNPKVITNVNLLVTANLNIGMSVAGDNIAYGTYIVDIDYNTGSVLLNNEGTPGTNLDITFYVPHKLKVGSKVSIHSGALQGIHTVTGLSEYKITFASTITGTSGLLNYYGVVPQFRAQIGPGSDEEWFLYDITYGTKYPTITKTKSIDFELTNASLAAIPDNFTSGNGEFIRQVFDSLEKRPFQLNVGVQADVEGVYVGEIDILDVTFTTSSKVLFNSLVECEVEGEDERLGLLLENFGRDITFEEERLLRDSDINEDNTNFILLNQKRKEMLLQGDQIWPYVGAYKGLVNMVNWFGYYDIRIKEYFLNINAEDVNFGKYRQVQIPFQLAEKGKHPESENLVPSKYYKKTSLFGLYYDIVRNSGEFDTFGVPETEDAFTYTNEEALVKLFGLKNYLKQKFLPLNTRIVDITGEGVYYERYNVNSWSDRNDRFLVDVGKKIDFTCDKTSQIIDLRPYDSNGGLLTPELDSSLGPYANSYSFNDVIITSYGSNFYGEIPQVVFPGSALQQARGQCRVRGMVTIPLGCSTFTGIGYAIGDIITLSGGTYEVPLRIVVAGVSSGAVTDFEINAGPQQGSNYTSLPTTFAASTVLRSDGSQYYVPDAVGFTIAASDIPFEVQEVTLYDLGLNYSTYPTAQFLWTSPSATTPTATLNVKQNSSAAVSYYSDQHDVKKYGDSPNIPIGAIINMSTTFEVTWDELPYPWYTFTGSNDATLKAWTDVSPSGAGQLIAVEIVSAGTDYNFAPTFTVTGGGGYSAVVTGQIRSGKLNIVEYEVATVVATDQLTLTPSIATGGLNAITTGHIVKGDGIPDGTIIQAIAGNDIYLISYDGTSTTTTITAGKKIYVHQGVTVTNGGADYTSDPLVSPNGGHTSTLYTWAEIGRGNSYQMEWKIFLTTPDDPTKVFNTQSGISTIDALINYQTIVPYTGKYTIQLDVYDTNNNISNKIKHDVINVYIPESDFAFITKNVDDCKDTWNEFHQIQQPANLQSQFTPSAPIDQPDPIVYDWDHATGRWVNVTFNNTDWNDCDINWDTLSVTDLSDINNPSFPPCNDIEVLQISAEDNLEGSVIGYTDSTTTPSSVNPTIIVSGQKTLPVIDPAYDPTDWIFIRRGDNVYHLEVLSADYSVAGETSIELATTPPLAFTNSPATWEVLREIGGTVVVTGDQIYNVNTNPTGFKIGEYLKLAKQGNTPISKRNQIWQKYTGNFDIRNSAGQTNLQKIGSYGRVYKVRDYIRENGNLNWRNTSTAAKTISSIAGTAVAGAVGNTYQVIVGSQQIEVKVTVNAAGSYSTNSTIQIVNGGVGFSVGNTVTIPGASLGGSTPTNNLTFNIATLENGSAWQFIEKYPNDPEKSDHLGQLVFNTKQISSDCDILNEIRPGFTRMTLYVYNGANLVYQQIFRTKHAYFDTSTTGDIFNIWGRSSYVVDVIGISGGNLGDLNTVLNDYVTLYGNPSIYLEYEYNEFTTRQRYFATNGLHEKLYLDYNSFPESSEFSTSITFANSSYFTKHQNWYFDQGIVGNDYSLKILNTGVWKNGVGTILTLDDNNVELYRSDTFFTACQQNFDEDYAETHLGTLVQNWANYEELLWEEFCGNTWDTLDYDDSLWCGFIIDEVDSNGGIKFNEYTTFNFNGIVGGMSDAEKFSQALWELNNSDNPGVSKFDYSIYAGATGANNYVTPGWAAANYYINATQKIGTAKLNTYVVPDAVLYKNSVTIATNDVLYGTDFVEPATVVSSIVLGTSIDPSFTNLIGAYTSKDIPKKAKFTADATINSYRLKNVLGLQEGDIRVGEIVTGNNLPSYPSTPAKVLQLVVRNGVIREIILDSYLAGSEQYGYFEVEWVTPDNTFITIPWLESTLTQVDMQIFANAKNPSVDNLGYLLGTNGVTFLPPQYPITAINTTTAHTFPMSNFYYWFGFGENKVGAFQYGLQEFLTKYRYAQVYLYEGTSPFGEPGWYPANDLPPAYTYTNNPLFGNYLEAKAQSERLPYERSIGGAYTWEETRIGKYTTKIPSGSSVMLSAESSDIAGKTQYFWRIKEGDTILAETTDNRIFWTYDYPGNFDVELTITDTNGNKSTKTKKSFLNIYEAAE